MSVTSFEYDMDARLQHPFTCCCAGMTGCGKTKWVQKLLMGKEQTIKGYPENIIWCYGEYQPTYEELSQEIPYLKFVEGFPEDIFANIDPSKKNLIIIDDLMSEIGNDKRLTALFTKGSHHRNLSVILILQNLFHQSKEMRTISLNSHYLVIFRNPRDKSQINHLAKQMYPGNIKYMQQSYNDATSEPYGYLLIDLKPETSDEIRLRTKIFPGETTSVYVPKNI